jgi:beta-catenin-like protein 1
MEAGLIELLTQNLSRLDETSETDRAGVYYVLGKYKIMKTEGNILM